MKNISTALVRAQKQFGPALKTSTNPHFKNKYADLSACIEAVIDALNENGIYLLQKNYDCPDGIMVETVFVHESGEMMETGIVHFPAVKKDPQGYASALTYGRRYSLMAACGIAPADDDGNRATAPTSGFSDKWLPVLESAAKNGSKALQTAFQGIPNSNEKAQFWAEHGNALKEAANGAA